MRSRKKETTHVGAELDHETYTHLERWAATEGRSRRQIAALLLRRLMRLEKSKPDEFNRLGLIVPRA